MSTKCLARDAPSNNKNNNSKRNGKMTAKTTKKRQKTNANTRSAALGLMVTTQRVSLRQK